jgi:DNA invertase Pin-like site-specific DNA recombinase
MINQIQTSKELAKLFKKLKQTEEIDIKSLKFVLYARKSSKDKKHQTRSIPDQIQECKEKAEHLQINIVKIIKEKESAKEPNIRPKFRFMLDQIKNGKYDAILSWHPDRLSRNMMEAGEIIDLLDKKIIKSLKFPSFEFTNDPSGKMLLGMAFVLSKQYTDKLSTDVTRGIRKSIEEGKYLHKGKHGYYKDRNQILRPEEHQFKLLQQAWYLRDQGKTLDEIADFLNQNQYQRRFGVNSPLKIATMNKKTLSTIFRDPVYCGVLIYGDKHICDLNDVIEDFVPMINVELFLKLNHLDNEKGIIKLVNKYKTNVLANLMRGKIICGYCNKPFTSGITVKTKKDDKGNIIKKEHRYYYKCETKNCEYRNKSTAPRDYLEFVCQLFIENQELITNKKAFDLYLKYSKKEIRAKIKELLNMRQGFYKTQGIQENKIKNLKSYITNPDNDEQDLIDDFKEDLIKENNELNKTKKSILDITTTIDNSKNVFYDYQKFLELMSKIPSRIKKSKDLTELNTIIKNIFSNFILTNREVTSYELKEPFKQIFEGAIIPKVTRSRG